MTKSLQRISAMASALVITFTSTLALAFGPIDWVKQKIDEYEKEAMDKLEGVLEPFDTAAQVNRAVATTGLEDFLGQNFLHVFVIWTMFFALTMVATRNWKKEGWMPYRHYLYFLLSYLLSVAYGRVYEASRTFRHPDALEMANNMLLAVPIVLLISLAVQHNIFKNMWEVRDNMRAFLQHLDPRNRILPTWYVGGGPVPVTVVGPTVVPTPDTTPDTPTDLDKPDDTTDSPPSEPSSDLGLRKPKPTFEDLIPMTLCTVCGSRTAVGGKCCVQCGLQEQAKAEDSIMVKCPRCDDKTLAGKCCVWCGLSADRFPTREEGVTTSSQDDDDMYSS